MVATILYIFIFLGKLGTLEAFGIYFPVAYRTLGEEWTIADLSLKTLGLIFKMIN